MKHLRLLLPVFMALGFTGAHMGAPLLSEVVAQTIEEQVKWLIGELITDPPIVIVEDEVQVGGPAGPSGPHADYQVVPKLQPGSPEYNAKAEKLREKRRRDIQAKLVALGPAAVPTIGAALANQGLPYREYLAEALARIGEKRAVPYLIDYLDEGLGKLRAAESLAKVGETEQAEVQKKEGILVITTAVESLRTISGQPYGNDPKMWRAW
jgi:hypothetical protein